MGFIAKEEITLIFTPLSAIHMWILGVVGIVILTGVYVTCMFNDIGTNVQYFEDEKELQSMMYEGLRTVGKQYRN